VTLGVYWPLYGIKNGKQVGFEGFTQPHPSPSSIVPPLPRIQQTRRAVGHFQIPPWDCRPSVSALYAAVVSEEAPSRTTWLSLSTPKRGLAL